MGYWDDPRRPLSTYSDLYVMPNGRTPRQHARIQRAFKELLRIRLIQDAASAGIDLFEPRRRFELVVGETYLAVRCRACGVQFTFFAEADTASDFYFTNRVKK